jgi:hypothetical protein
LAGLSLTADQTNSAVYILLGVVGLIGACLPDTLTKKETANDHSASPPEGNDKANKEQESTIYEDTKDEQTGFNDR